MHGVSGKEKGGRCEMMEEVIADVLMAATMLIGVPGFLIFIACLYVEAADAMDQMERQHKGRRG